MGFDNFNNRRIFSDFEQAEYHSLGCLTHDITDGSYRDVMNALYLINLQSLKGRERRSFDVGFACINAERSTLLPSGEKDADVLKITEHLHAAIKALLDYWKDFDKSTEHLQTAINALLENWKDFDKATEHLQTALKALLAYRKDFDKANETVTICSS